MSAKALVDALLESWQPGPHDIAWTQAHLARLNDGAMWITSEGVFRVDKKNKVLHWQGFDGQLLDRVRKCCARIGWRVIVQGQAPPEEHSFSA